MNFSISEIVSVKVNGKWYDAEILDINDSSAYVYIFDLHTRKNVSLGSVR
jgi:hypothetical protein